MIIKTTEEIMEEKDIFIDRHYKETDEWTDEAEKIMQQKWIKVDDNVKIILDKLEKMPKGHKVAFIITDEVTEKEDNVRD